MSDLEVYTKRLKKPLDDVIRDGSDNLVVERR